MEALPNELLLDIFENLDYWDLKLNILNVCKRFRELLLSPQRKKGKIDKLLFRDQPDPDFDSTSNERNRRERVSSKELETHGYVIHPVFKSLEENKYNFQKNIDKVSVRKLREHESPGRRRSPFYWRDWPLKDLDVANENITSPAITTAHFKHIIRKRTLRKYIPLTIEGTGNVGAITLMDVWKDGICAWAQNDINNLYQTLNWHDFDHMKFLNEVFRECYAWDICALNGRDGRITRRLSAKDRLRLASDEAWEEGDM